MATIVVAIALVVGAAGLIAALRRTMVDEVAEAARAQAIDVVRQLEAGRPPVLEVAGADEQLIQVMTPAGAVVASSPNMAGRPAVVRLAPGQSAKSSRRWTTTSSSRWPRARKRLTACGSS